jgi:L-lactate dehydrogenase complex protein LldF
MKTKKKKNVVDLEAIGLAKSPTSRASVRNASEKKVVSRSTALSAEVVDPNALRHQAAERRQHVIDHLDEYLVAAEKAMQANGVQVHWAANAEEARQLIVTLCKEAGVRRIAKSKSMVTEEIHLNDALKAAGMDVIETDLGEFVVQLDNDHPSHIVTPIIHKNRKDVAATFAREGISKYDEDPERLTMAARSYLRRVFEDADCGITGANFFVAETGRLVTVSNEGNLRLTANTPRLHIALTGIEKVVATEEDLALLLKLLARSATGQSLTVYTQFLGGPRGPKDPDGPDAMHVVLLDNGRTNLLGGRYREMLRCIRCGACLNVCPVYRAVTGHGYGSVYPGPMGAIFSPLLGGDESRRKYAYLPKASSLCGACEEVCPVAIPIPKMLVALREESTRNALPAPDGTPPWAPWTFLSTSPTIWRTALEGGRTFGWGPAKFAPVAAFQRWLQHHELPEWPEQSFRSWWKKRDNGDAK